MSWRTAVFSRRLGWLTAPLGGFIVFGILALHWAWPGRPFKTGEPEAPVSRVTIEVRPGDVVVYRTTAKGLSGSIVIRQRSSWFLALLEEMWDSLRFGRPGEWDGVVVTTYQTDTGSLLFGLSEAGESK